MDILNIINATVVAIGIPTVALTLISIGRKLQVLDSLKEDVGKIKPDLQDVRERFATLEGKAANFFITNSPVKLTEKGEEFLKESGLKNYIDKNSDKLFNDCLEKSDLATPYDVQEVVYELFDNYEFPKEIEDKLKTYTYNQGTNLEVARRIGSLYFRDYCLKRLNFKIEDLD